MLKRESAFQGAKLESIMKPISQLSESHMKNISTCSISYVLCDCSDYSPVYHFSMFDPKHFANYPCSKYI